VNASGERARRWLKTHELANIDVMVSGDDSPELADPLARGKLDLAFLRSLTCL
jgi:LysR family hca operon transcriptional activator